MAWRLFDHTADVGIEADGDGPEDVLGHAARALVAVVTGKPEGLPMRKGEHVTFEIEAPDHGALAVAFLSELLWLMESRGVLWISGGVTIEAQPEGLHLHGEANMARFDTRVHGGGVEVKAVTYHELFFGRDGQRWRLRVILDI